MALKVPFDLHPAKIVKDCRAEMGEWSEEKLKSLAFHAEYDYVQLKHDGWWIAILFKEGIVYYITSGAEVRHMFRLSPKYKFARGILIAEWMYGTNWANLENRSGRIIIFDTPEFSDGGDMRASFWKEGTYRERLKFLRKCRPIFNEIFPKNSAHVIDTSVRMTAKELWKTEQDFEGLVFKKSEALFNEKGASVKMKRTYTLDYVCMDIMEGEGRLKGSMGAIVGGMYLEGKLTAVCSIGGGFDDYQRQEIFDHPKKYKGKVFEASGKAIFRKVTLRHPCFNRWRPDKLPKNCKPRA